MTRVYVPATLTDLARYAADGLVPSSADRLVATGDDEESEYAALSEAATESSALLNGPGRRVVVVADVVDADGEIAMSAVVAVHCDTRDRPPGADPDEDLAWFATQEIPELV